MLRTAEFTEEERLLQEKGIPVSSKNKRMFQSLAVRELLIILDARLSVILSFRSLL